MNPRDIVHERVLFVFIFLAQPSRRESLSLRRYRKLFIYVEKPFRLIVTMTLKSSNDKRRVRKRKSYLVIIKYLEAIGQAEQLFNLYTKLFSSRAAFSSSIVVIVMKPIFINIVSLVARSGGSSTSWSRSHMKYC